MSNKNYLKLALDCCYELLIDPKYKWPVSFNNKMKKKFIESFLEYYQEDEDYEKCAALQETYKTILK